MAKRKRSTVWDRIEGNAAREVETLDEETKGESEAEAEPEPKPAPVADISVTMPMGEIPRLGYVGRHVEVKLDREQARKLGRIRAGLQARGETVGANRPIRKLGDVVRWMLDRIGEAE